LLKKFERFLADDQANWEERKVGGWDADNRQAVLDAVVRVVGGDQWAAIVQAGLESDDQFEFETALQAAQYVGIDPWDELYRRSGVGQQYWYQLTRTSDAERIRRVVDLAERTIPLAEIATGPDTELGFGPEYQHHNNLDCILQRLGGHPELGWTLIETGMRSPLVRNRYKSVKALAGWPRDQWPQGAQEHVERCSEAEPDGKLRARFQELLDGTV